MLTCRQRYIGLGLAMSSSLAIGTLSHLQFSEPLHSFLFTHSFSHSGTSFVITKKVQHSMDKRR